MLCYIVDIWSATESTVYIYLQAATISNGAIQLHGIPILAYPDDKKLHWGIWTFRHDSRERVVSRTGQLHAPKNKETFNKKLVLYRPFQ